MVDYTLKEIISAKDIQNRVKELARDIEEDYRNREVSEVIFVGILKGAFIFLADLLRNLNLPAKVDFMRISTYGLNTVSSEEIKITKDIELDIRDKHVLLVEDIVDTGYSLKWVVDYLLTKKPASLKVCVFIDKKERRRCAVEVDYVGFTVEQGFLVGYGLDYSEKYRHLPGIYEVCFSGVRT
ncbi:hypoxanthine phosphoribosyltransferase [Thermodesulforhabdus norvegica]|uniref:Hypoxanthine phosphoribosyltransferase n=1 Tax=Thermodesulforhabdus norvegica TaxID=39841 RepID=A0A1I4T946_9BACT|nr:hypoxanthine phosphoribosyltransferase [Thermodesulforhabdus norvegica]SFM73131.1 hypoxanthine phosphoribosyltransferase [Thermodesulforhabdus norvegica]